MNKLSPKLIAIITLLALTFVGFQVKSFYANSNNPVKIGFVGPLTGGPALWGEGARNMTQLAIEEINRKGGINGRPIEVTYEDGKCTPPGAVSATQKLVREGIKAILGGHCSPETTAMVPLSKDGSFVMVAGVTSSDNAVADSEFAYRTSPANKDFTVQLTKEAIKKYKKVATITEQAAYSKSYTDDFIADFNAVGGEIVGSEEYKPEQIDFRTELSKLKVKGADAIFISPQSPTTGTAIIKQMQELGMTTPIFGNSVLVTKDVFEKSGKSPLFEKAFAIIPYTDASQGKAKELAGKYQAKYGSPVPYNFFYVSASYDATYMVRNAMKKCDVDTECMADFFKAINYNGASSNYTFKENGDSNFNSWATIAISKEGSPIITPLK